MSESAASGTATQVEVGTIWARILAAGAKAWHLIHDGAADVVKVSAEHPEVLKEAEALLPPAADVGINAALEIANVVNGISDQATTAAVAHA